MARERIPKPAILGEIEMAMLEEWEGETEKQSLWTLNCLMYAGEIQKPTRGLKTITK